MIFSDSITKQCAEDFFYGKDSPIDNQLQDIEGESGSVIKEIIEKGSLPLSSSQDHNILLRFIITLHSRTKSKYIEQDELIDKLLKAYLKLNLDADKDLLNKIRIQVDTKLHLPTLTALSHYRSAQDLRSHLFLNKTDIDFITSDNPVVFYNKWAEDVKTRGTIGLKSQGLLIFLPLSSEIVICLYDSVIYKIGNKRDLITILKDPKEVENLNGFQWLQSLDNIYFYAEEDKNKIIVYSDKYLPHRSEDKIKARKRGNVENGWHSTKPNIKLQINAIKIKKAAKGFESDEKILKIRNPDLLSRT